MSSRSSTVRAGHILRNFLELHNPPLPFPFPPTATATATPGFKKIGRAPTPTPFLKKIPRPRLRLRVKVRHRLLNLCACDIVLSERCRQTNSQDILKIIIRYYYEVI